MDLKDLDLNLLLVFNELYRLRSVSRAGEALGLSQSAVSNALRRLRIALGDELFVRVSRGMAPTHYAEELSGSIDQALGTLRASLAGPASFQPATSTRNFTIAMSDIGEIYFLPELMKRLARLAPGVSVSTVRDTTISLRSEMESGQVDLAIGFLPDLRHGFFQRRLFRQRYVCVFRRGHRLAAGGFGLKEFKAAERVAIVAAGTGHGTVDATLRRAGLTDGPRLSVPHFVAVGHILQSTDMIAVVPQAYAESTLKPFGLVFAPCPIRLPEIVIRQLWHGRNHREPGNQWLRRLISESFSF